MLVEYRGDDVQTVFPGSRHKDTGEAIAWSKDGAPARITREKLERAVGEPRRRGANREALAR